jgi:hypothetical protein
MSGPLDVNPYAAPSPSNPNSAAGQWGSQGDSGVSPKVVEMLRQTQPWVRFLSVLFFIGFVLLLVGGVIGLLFSLTTASGELAMVFAIYAVMAVLYLAPAVFLGRYATNIAQFRLSLRVQDLENAMEAQKSFWRFAGIAALVVLVLYALIFVLGFAGMAFFTWSRSPF